ncbi:MAG: putative L-shaped tail fiber protein [Prokaryotic dsDNA virus sp.]|nr:MAG: putative L-shaped tail fiber protein [Prokaryotic dsDNA virus sp.]|tara:strand:- start:2985 stop:3347 length:363 start_codon:yes stop_codon:yes gene_type:complete
MAAGVYNFELEQGADHIFRITYTDGVGTPIDITGYTAVGTIKLKLSDSSVWATMNVVVENGPAGIFFISIPASETTGKMLKSSKHDDYVEAVYDIKITDTSGNQHRLLNGIVNISPEVSV